MPDCCLQFVIGKRVLCDVLELQGTLKDLTSNANHLSGRSLCQLPFTFTVTVSHSLKPRNRIARGNRVNRAVLPKELYRLIL